MNTLIILVSRFVNWLASLIDTETLNQPYRGSNQPNIPMSTNQDLVNFIARRLEIANEHGVTRVYIQDYEIGPYQSSVIRQLLNEQHGINIKLHPNGIEAYRGAY